MLDYLPELPWRLSWPNKHDIVAVCILLIFISIALYASMEPIHTPFYTNGCGITIAGESDLKTLSPAENQTPSGAIRGDPDGDNIPSATELEYGSDPLRKSIYLYLLYGKGQPSLGTEEKVCLQQRWAQMNVSNPDNSTGVDIYFSREERLDRPVSFKFRPRSDLSIFDPYVNSHTPRDCIDHVVIAGWSKTPGIDGFAAFGGYASFVDIENSTTPIYLITHELLHSTVGKFRNGSEYSHHTSGGLLHPNKSTWDLPTRPSQDLNKSGFASHDQSIYGRC
jgi:hypothetical protein